jgi:hypothetical protein
VFKMFKSHETRLFTVFCSNPSLSPSLLSLDYIVESLCCTFIFFPHYHSYTSHFTFHTLPITLHTLFYAVLLICDQAWNVGKYTSYFSSFFLLPFFLVIVIVILLFFLAARVHADISHLPSQHQYLAQNDQSGISKYIQIPHHTHFPSFTFPFLPSRQITDPQSCNQPSIPT